MLGPLHSCLRLCSFSKRMHRAPACASSRCRNSTTSFLTAATLRYTLGVGITAAAGTKTCPPIKHTILTCVHLRLSVSPCNKFPVTTFLN
uniref:Putative ovule protein n=1 Tax=Solanum chacoense TaxID=4108 RepID=A0A0V0H428_SOLCH